MRICRNVGITHNQTHKKLHQLPQGSYPSIGYHSTYQIPLALYVLRNAETYKEPMYLISNVLTGPQIYNVYKRRMQIEHAFRDIKSTFGFAKLVLKKDQRARIALLWFIAVLTYGLLFLAYEKTIATWEKQQPTEKDARPGQFIHVMISQGPGLLLRRPFTIYTVAGHEIHDALSDHR